MSVVYFNENTFRIRVNAALEKVKRILENERTPAYAADVHHEYADKYVLAEFLTNTSIAASLNVLQNALGVKEKDLAKLREWNQSRSVTLRFKAEETCKFLRKVEREVKSDTTKVTETTVFGNFKSYTVTKVTEWFWQFDGSYSLIAYQGADVEKGITLLSRNGTVELKTTTENTPKPSSVVRPSLEVNISWLLGKFDKESGKVKFSIDRAAKSCHTPRRNDEIDAALRFYQSIYSWGDQVHRYFMNDLFPVQVDHGLDLSIIKDQGLFNPVLPLFDKTGKKAKSKDEKSPAGSGVVPLDYMNPFLDEQLRALEERFKEAAKVLPSDGKLITAAEARILIGLIHVRQIASAHSEGVDYIEDMLRKQLIAAIGKEVQPVDFSHYLRFHYRKLFKHQYQPKAFCYAIRRPDHYPEGTLSIEADIGDGTIADPIATIVSESMATRPMKFALDASTKVSFYGERFLHGVVNHQFSGATNSAFSLVARARQFSSFIVLVGRIASAELFEPKYGLIVKDKDELTLPLMLETIPTPKEFKDAIESLSPEQQRFAKAFRSMQLESTLFGVVVIQIKPQLEKLLKLPNDSLTKEIALTQDLQQLFIDYQIPSDLLSYDGDASASVSTKIDTVRRYVKNMQDMIQRSKNAQLQEAQQQQAYRVAEDDALAARFDSYDEEEAEEVVKYEEEKLERRSKKEYKMKSKSKDSDMKKDKKSSFSPRKKMAAPSVAMKERAAPAPAAKPAAPVSKPAAPAAPVATPTPSTGAKPIEAPKPVEAQPKIDDEKAIVEEEPEESELVDYTKIPQELESKFEELDEDSALRPTIINPGAVWSKKFKKSLLSEMETTSLGPDEQGKERNKAFDLLDALTKSGALSVDMASLHVVIAATHCFDKTLMNTLIQDNINPIEKVERSALIVASTIHDCEPQDLLAVDQVERVGTYSPMLIDNVAANAEEQIGTPSIAVHQH